MAAAEKEKVVFFFNPSYLNQYYDKNNFDIKITKF